MGGSIKFVLEYEKAFWRSQQLSGMLFSHVGIVTEMYDHTNKEENKFGFTGFLHPQASTFSMEERRNHVINYLASFFGEAVNNFQWYEDKIWKGEFLLGGNPALQHPHQNNGHQLLLKPYMNSKLFFSGTETSSVFPGYMDAAVASAKRVAQQIIDA